MITEDYVRELVGIPKLIYINKIVDNIINENIEEIIRITNDIINEGKDIDYILWEIIKYIKDVLVFKSIGKLEIYSDEEIKSIKLICDKTTKEKLLDLIYQLSELANDIKWSSQRNIIFQAGIIRVCLQEKEIKSDLSQKKEGKQEYKEIKHSLEERKEESKKTVEIPQNDKKLMKEKTSESTEYLPCWSKILEALKQTGKVMIYTNLLGTKAKKINDMMIGIEFTNKITDFGKTILEKHENKSEIERLISLEVGKPMNVKFIQNGSEGDFNNYKITNMIGELNIPMNIIDE